jgi:hypothetical protein
VQYSLPAPGGASILTAGRANTLPASAAEVEVAGQCNTFYLHRVEQAFMPAGRANTLPASAAEVEVAGQCNTFYLHRVEQAFMPAGTCQMHSGFSR